MITYLAQKTHTIDKQKLFFHAMAQPEHADESESSKEYLAVFPQKLY